MEEQTIIKTWNSLPTGKKRHLIFSVTSSRTLAFWYVCGKERQKYYQKNIVFDDNNVDLIRKQIYDEYITCLEKKENIFDKEEKLNKIKKVLLIDD